MNPASLSHARSSPCECVCVQVRNGAVHVVNVYPTLQFLYSTHIDAEYLPPSSQSTLILSEIPHIL